MSSIRKTEQFHLITDVNYMYNILSVYYYLLSIFFFLKEGFRQFTVCVNRFTCWAVLIGYLCYELVIILLKKQHLILLRGTVCEL